MERARRRPRTRDTRATAGDDTCAAARSVPRRAPSRGNPHPLWSVPSRKRVSVCIDDALCTLAADRDHIFRELNGCASVSKVAVARG